MVWSSDIHRRKMYVVGTASFKSPDVVLSFVRMIAGSRSGESMRCDAVDLGSPSVGCGI